MFESVHPSNEALPTPAPDKTGELPYEYIRGDLEKGLVILCDHASNKVPDTYNHLGLPPAQFERHIAYDIGAGQVVRQLAENLGVPAILGRYSRLLIDLNRGIDDPTMIMKLSDGAVIPGNCHIDQEEAQARIARYYRPYHRKVDDILDQGIKMGKPPAILSVHSFTPVWKDIPRPWHATILWDKDSRLPERMLQALRAQDGIVTDDNVPYSGELEGDCMNQHGTRRGLAHALIEIRQDQINSPAGIHEWSTRLSTMMGDILKTGGLNQILHFG
ncbi:MAG TPA: N-formylglutamate amidohydrolase [Rhizobiales bacterium]|nr:N-formylglutamate amidohydrolase [Hyphomicrobiales bacterium]